MKAAYGACIIIILIMVGKNESNNQKYIRQQMLT